MEKTCCSSLKVLYVIAYQSIKKHSQSIYKWLNWLIFLHFCWEIILVLELSVNNIADIKPKFSIYLIAFHCS